MKLRAKIYFLACALACVLAPSALAQEGHPLAGIWSGDWGPTPTERYPVLIDLMWETTTLSGIINPGFPDAAPIRVGMLDSRNWTVHLEADARDEDGSELQIIVDGELENIGSPNRTLSGTWSRGGSEGDFKLTRE